MIVKTFKQRMLLNGSIVTAIYVVIGVFFVLNGHSAFTVLPPLTVLYFFVLLVHYLYWRPKINAA